MRTEPACNGQDGPCKDLRKKRVSARRKYFAKHKINVPPSAHADAELSSVCVVLTLKGYTWEVGGGVM